ATLLITTSPPPPSTLFPYTTLFRSFGAAALDTPVDQSRNAGRVIAAVFEAAQTFEQPRRDHIPGDNADDAAHQFFLCSRVRISRSEEHTSELQSRGHLVCRLLLEKK